MRAAPARTTYDGSEYVWGISIHFVNCLVSPGLPGFMLYEWSKCGPGCANGVVFIFLLPVVWALFLWGNACWTRARYG